MAEWVSFPEIKARVAIAEVLARYGLLDEMRKQGSDELVGGCPFHQGKSREPFHVSLSKNAFRCFAPHCDKKGNMLDFVMFKEGSENIREAALLVQGWFPDGVGTATESTESVVRPQGDISVPLAEESPVNPALKFALKGLDMKHPYLRDRGLDKETIDYFGVGYCSRGMMKDRIVIPIHDERGELVAYCGRWPGDDGWPDGEEKYKLPGGFLKSHVLFNMNRVGESAKENVLIVVEGFFSCFWLYQCGYPNVVALMGSSISEHQRDLLVAAVGSQGKITLLLDGDEAGQKCQEQCLGELSRQMFVKVIELGVLNQQPDHLSQGEISQLFAG